MAFTEFQKNMLMLTSLFCSLCSGLVFKTQQRQYVDGQQFSHPICQTLQMFIGEIFCYGVFMWYRSTYKADYEEGRVQALKEGATDKINIFYFAVPALCDFVSSTISFFSMSMMPLSVQYMFNGGNIIMTAIFSIVFLKRKLHRQNYFGISLNCVGLIFMGFMTLVVDPPSDSDDNNDSSSKMLVGMLLTVGSFFTYATQMVVEEKFFSKFYLHPFQAVGLEGVWGTLYTALAIVLFSFIKSPQGYDSAPNGYIEDFPNYVYQIFSFHNVPLFFLFIASIIVIIVLNGVGQAVTKYVSSLARAVLGVTSPFLLWIACLIIGWEQFKYYQLISYFIITTGTLIYNEIIVIPLFGMNVNLRRHALAAQKEVSDQPLLSGNAAKQSLARANNRRSHRSFKSISAYNEEPLDD